MKDLTLEEFVLTKLEASNQSHLMRIMEIWIFGFTYSLRASDAMCQKCAETGKRTRQTRGFGCRRRARKSRIDNPLYKAGLEYADRRALRLDHLKIEYIKDTQQKI
jgi:hypothetical protein